MIPPLSKRWRVAVVGAVKPGRSGSTVEVSTYTLGFVMFGCPQDYSGSFAGGGEIPTLSVSRCPTGRRQEFARPRRGHPPVEVDDQVSGPVRHAGFPSSRRGARCLRCFRQRPHRPRAAARAGAGPSAEPALGEPVVRTGRSRQAAVGISDGGSRQQRLSDVAVAARPRQPDVAGAERVPQVEQHRRLPERR